MKGFTLLEMLIALTVAAILAGVSLNVYSMFSHGMAETSVSYVRFATEKSKELRCRTRFVRGVSPISLPCDSVDLAPSRTDFRQRF